MNCVIKLLLVNEVSYKALYKDTTCCIKMYPMAISIELFLAHIDVVSSFFCFNVNWEIMQIRPARKA